MFYRNATEVKIANLEKRLNRLEKKAFFDILKSTDEIVKEEMLELHPKMKQLPRSPGGLTFFLTINNNRENTIEKEHTWYFIVDTLEKNDSVILDIMISPFQGGGSRSQWLHLDKNLFRWKDQCKNDRDNIGRCLNNFFREFKANHEKMVDWSVNHEIIETKMLTQVDRDITNRYFSNR